MKIDTRLAIEIIGILSVVASLVFVGMQLVLDRRVAVAEQFQNRAELRLQFRLGQFENDKFMQDLAKNWENNRPRWWNEDVEAAFIQENEPMETWVRRSTAWELFLITIDNNCFQHQSGMLEDDMWLSMRETLKRQQRNPVREAFHQGISLPCLNSVFDEISTEIQIENRAQ